AIQPLLPRIERFFDKTIGLVADENTPVLFHNDFQSQNILVEEKQDEFVITGLIDFDNWRIGPPAQDFVKIQYWTIQDLEHLNDAFFRGYRSIHKDVSQSDLQERINIYKMLWFILVYNFEMDKVLKNERNVEVDRRFPAADKYLAEIEKVLKKTSC
ncbi:MAG: phosphotransferase, partial [Candidatus Lokiarchaeota archaeon]|nr:phosphotransferase [Candidatus Lokiarchaeota archaeon]